MLILNGKEVAKEVRSALVPRVANFKEKTGRAPHLSVVSADLGWRDLGTWRSYATYWLEASIFSA